MHDTVLDHAHRDFLGYVEGNDMEILRDEGLYRHVRFGGRGACGWFELVTWPGFLAIAGDLGDYTFARTSDMFEFFASDSERINPHYWAEKIRAARDEPREFSEERFRQLVVEHFWSRRHNVDPGEAIQLFRAIRRQVLEDVYSDAVAHANLDTFSYLLKSGRMWTFRDAWEWDLREWSIHYLRACHAIAWGVAQYREAKAVTR